MTKYNLEDLHNIGQKTYKKAAPIKKVKFVDKLLGVLQVIVAVILYGTILNVYKFFKRLFSLNSGKKNIAGQLALVN